jgi:hypothetical protein
VVGEFIEDEVQEEARVGFGTAPLDGRFLIVDF